MTTQERIEMLEERLSDLKEQEAKMSPTLTNLSDEMDRLLDLVNDDKLVNSYARVMEVNRQYARVKHQYLNLEEDYKDCALSIHETENMLVAARAQLEWEEAHDGDC